MTDPSNREQWWRIAAREVWLPTAQEMAELDRYAIESGSIPERALIECAGREFARYVHMRWPEGPVVALAGSGHNGADALVALRSLHAWGRPVRAVLCGNAPPEPDVLKGWDIPLVDPTQLASCIQDASVVLDGILGTGLTSAPREPQASYIAQANAAGVPIAAVDGPSGANFTSGQVPGACIRADLCVTFGWPKIGLLSFPAREYCGDLLAVEIGFPPPPQPPGARAITARWVRDEMLERRGADAHKGRSGYLTLVAGQAGMAGAAVLAARAAVRGGAGIVRVVSDPGNREIIQSAAPEAVFVPWDSREAVAEAVEWAHAVAVGPGLGQAAERRGLVEAVLDARAGRPALVDADGLNAWSGEPDALARALNGNAVLTPHPGELARLLDVPIEEILADPPAAARHAAARLGCTVLLKGAPSLVAEAGQPLRVSTIASAGFATGGVGDVLSGLAGAYLATGMGPADAASAALMIAGIAALRAPHAIGHAASDIPEAIPGVRAELEGRLGSAGSAVFASPLESLDPRTPDGHQAPDE